MKTNKIKPVTIKEQVYNKIKNEIITGEIKQGEQLLEIKLSEKYGVSRSPIREALRELVCEGLLINKPNRGVYARVLTKKDIYEIFEFRGVIENYSIEKIIKNFDEDNRKCLLGIKEKLLNSYRDDNYREYYLADAELHNSIILMANNKIMSKAFQNVSPLLEPFRVDSLKNPERFKISILEHLNIIDAILAKNLDRAIYYNMEHLTLSREDLLKKMKHIDF